MSNILKPKLSKNKLKVASMFAGCGGLDYAFHKRNNIFSMVYVNDFDKDSCESYQNYYKFNEFSEISYISK